ncbi:sensor histidine kinase [Flammeovirga kamogawensis]|uniref:Histidine kinase n=1 Tax=Flammeovirga kamogawensis TaxID=373891 RepID=A0ABX8H302_9BACT|nr:histidine kinase [Flammeovirga kamogawensis]MBB6460479.1 sensor histidine kinase YesM [Flammeovirga kamogawensis]QWG10285.1 histidine kinase [Flammeovirga kamogawensis]TRX64733.1 hypothetical protein EO216_19540 [Flammeovirga kamogawensis]
MKNKKLLKYGTSLGIGTAVMALVFSLLYVLDIIIIPINDVDEVLLVFCGWTIAAAVITHNFHYLKTQKPLFIKLLGLFSFFVFTLVYDENSNMVDNPITIGLLITFWVLVVAVLLPKFFHKYKYYFLPIYGLVLLYFSYIRFQPNYNSANNEDSFELLAFTIPILIILWVYEQWKWVKSLKSEKSQAELQLLKSQINPHFFFNTLNNLYGLTVEKSDKAPEVVLLLSDMMRYTIYQGKEDVVPIQDEIKYLENYIELHRIRYQKNVQIHFINSIISEYKISPLLFIILLENAFKHGVETLVENAFIFIEITEEDGYINFVIENNYDKSLTDQQQRGIGLDNLKQRLDLIYPQKYTYKEEISVDIYKAKLTLQLS